MSPDLWADETLAMKEGGLTLLLVTPPTTTAPQPALTQEETLRTWGCSTPLVRAVLEYADPARGYVRVEMATPEEYVRVEGTDPAPGV